MLPLRKINIEKNDLQEKRPKRGVITMSFYMENLGKKGKGQNPWSSGMT